MVLFVMASFFHRRAWPAGGGGLGGGAPRTSRRLPPPDMHRCMCRGNLRNIVIKGGIGPGRGLMPADRGENARRIGARLVVSRATIEEQSVECEVSRLNFVLGPLSGEQMELM